MLRHQTQIVRIARFVGCVLEDGVGLLGDLARHLRVLIDVHGGAQAMEPVRHH